MAEKDEYIGEAYEALKHMSEDEIKRMEYEARQKAIRDYHSYMHSAERRGLKHGIELGRTEGIESGRKELLKQLVEMKLAKGQSVEAIAEDLMQDVDLVRKIAAETEAE